MSDKRIILYFVIITLLFSSVSGFELFPSTSPDPLCQGATGIFTDVVQDSNVDYSVSLSGNAASFTTPILFRNTVYSLVTPRSTTPIGKYSLTIEARSSTDETSSLTHEVEVKECQAFSLKAIQAQKNICPCGTETFDFDITNLGDFTNTYNLKVEGPASNLITLSETRVTITKGETKRIFAFASNTCESLGNQDFTITATPELGTSIQSSSARLIIDSCYDFELKTEKDLFNLCEGEQDKIPITINNKGTSQNTFNLNINGPAWVSLEKNKLDIASSSSANTNIVIAPPLETAGDFDIPLQVTAEKGDQIAATTFKATVRKCLGVFVDIEKNQDRICNSLQNTYSVTVKNIGEKTQSYDLDITGPAWVSIDKGQVSLNAGEQSLITLTVAPPANVPSSTYSAEVIATAADLTQITGKDKVDITTVTQEECYKPQINVENNLMDVAVDSTATIPIIIENKGINTATYDISLSGTATAFTQLIPLSTGIEIAPNEAEVIHLYVAPNIQTPKGKYTVTVSVRLKDTTILDSETVDINVMEIGEAPQVVPEEIIEENITEEELAPTQPSLWTRIKSFFGNLFAPAPANVTEDITEISEIEIENITIPEEVEEEIIEENLTEEITEVVEEVVENVTGEENITEEVIEENVTEEQNIAEEVEEIVTVPGEAINLDELDIYVSKILVDESQKIIVEDSTYDVTLFDSTEDSVVLLFTGEIFVDLEVKESKAIDLDQDGTNDIRATLSGFEEGKAVINYAKLSEPSAAIIEEEVKEEKEEGPKGPGFFSNISNFIIRNKTLIISLIVLIILILLAILTKFHRKVIGFFEEEVEEEIPKEKKPGEEEVKKELKEDTKKVKEEKIGEKPIKKVEEKKVTKKRQGKKKEEEDFEIIH